MPNADPVPLPDVTPTPTDQVSLTATDLQPILDKARAEVAALDAQIVSLLPVRRRAALLRDFLALGCELDTPPTTDEVYRA